jgi:hypothetical protein
MRTVRGIDFDDLTEDDFKAIGCWLREQPVAIPKLVPRDDQLKRSSASAKHLQNRIVPTWSCRAEPAKR